MKNKEPEFTEEVLAKMAQHINEPMSYKDLVNAIGLKPKKDNSKASQLKKLASYCELEVTKSPTRYIIHDVYNGMIATMASLNGNNKFQRAFDVKLLKEFARHDGEKFYVSNTELYKLFDEVNDNFPYSLSAESMELLGPYYEHFPSIGTTVKRILHEWTSDRLAHMEGRKLFISRDGFRVYSKLDNMRIETNVLENSELEKLCQKCYYDAAEATMPDDWGDKKKGKYLVSPQQFRAFYNYMNNLLEERTHGQYTGLCEVKIISPQCKEHIDMIIVKEDTGDLPDVNQEVQRKILESKSIDFRIHKPFWRQRFIDVNIIPNPGINLRNEIAKKKAELNDKEDDN